MTSGADYNRSEELQARKDGATLVKNSGRGQKKGDARLGKWVLDYKFTEKKSFAVNQKDFNVLQKQAWDESFDKEAIIVICFPDGDNIACVDWEVLKELMGTAQRYEAVRDGG